ncbi:MAG: VOC family protein [Candidatus Atribacteria bacterium]|nr:VOC family protein [Candidatus Atribacteria bacterium]
MSERKIAQVCMMSKDIQKSMEKYWKIWGVGPWGIHNFTPEIIRDFMVRGKRVEEDFEVIIAVTGLGDMQIELIQPVKGPSIYWEFLDKKGEGIHHIKEYVSDEDMEKVLNEYKQKGIEVIQSGKFDDDVFYYLDTEPTLGYLLELGNCGKVREPARWYPTAPKPKKE